MNPALVVGCAVGGLAVGATISHTIEPGSDLGPRWRVTATALTAGLFALGAARLGAVPQLGAYCALFAGLVAVSVADIRAGIIPRRLLYPTLVLTALGLLCASADEQRWRPAIDALIGGVCAFVFFYAVWWLFPKGLGFGDVRLAGLLGLALGWLGFWPLYIGFLASFVCGTAVGLVLMVRQGTGRKTKLAFGPALGAGAVFGVLWGEWVVRAWLHRGG